MHVRNTYNIKVSPPPTDLPYCHYSAFCYANPHPSPAQVLPHLPNGRSRAILDDEALELGKWPILNVFGAAAVGQYRWARGAGKYADIDVLGIPSAAAVRVQQRGNHIFFTERTGPEDQLTELGTVLEIV